LIRFRQFKDPDVEEKLKFFGPAALITIIGFIIAYQFVAPAPPRTITMATGSPTGSYFASGEAYREILGQNGITLELIKTSGSVENLRLLEMPSGGADVAFVQGGLKELADSKNLVALGSLYFEPMWVFHRLDVLLEQLTDFHRVRIAIGPEGSGSRVLALQMLKLNGIDETNAKFYAYESQEAADSLLEGHIDVAFFVASHRSDYIMQLFNSNSVGILGIDRAEAYAIRYPFLHVLKLPEGVINFKDNIPSRDLMLVAPTAQLVARSDLHPALVNLLLQVAEKVHFKGGGFEKEGQFPTPKYIDYELSDEAARYYKSGSRFLQRYLPFWMANFINRMTVMLLPLVALLFPLFKLMPTIYRWRMRSKIYRWYAKFDDIDAVIFKEKKTTNTAKYISELDELEEKVAHIRVPLAFQEELYDLRLHIDLLRSKLVKENVDDKQES
jgi:TRAP transporter TAXI family solute receptor